MFEKKVKIYESKGKKEEFRQIKAALKAAGFRKVSATVWEDEVPVCGCGSKIDVRDFGPNGKIDRNVYTIRVLPADETKAAALVRELVPDYTPYQPSGNQFHMA